MIHPSAATSGLVNRKKLDEEPIINLQTSNQFIHNEQQFTQKSISNYLIIFSIIINILLFYFLFIVFPRRITSIGDGYNLPNTKWNEVTFLHQHIRSSPSFPKSFNIHDLIAILLTNKETTVGSYQWYKNQLEQFSLLGTTKFKDRVMTRFGFDTERITSPNMFNYFRTFSVKDNCKYQHSCQIYPFNDAIREFNMGNQLDAVLYYYHEPYKYISKPLHSEKKVIGSLWQSLTNFDLEHVSSMEGLQQLSAKIDDLNGENVWRGMRTLSIYMNSEALVEERLSNKIQLVNDKDSMQRFSNSHIDITSCFMKNCTVWINYLYQPIDLDSPKFASKNPTHSSICAFISNCIAGGQLPLRRLLLLRKLGQYVPVRQYGKCFNNAQEGPGGKAFELENNCKFYFAMENSLVPDYITEKFFEGMKALEKGAKILMIYKGAPNIHSFNFPKSMYINIDDYESVDELGKYLKFLNDNPVEFEKRFAQITKSDRIQANKAIDELNYKLGNTIPCRFCKSIGQVKLARYLLFKIGLVPKYYKVNFDEWKEFRSKFNYLGEERLAILDSIYQMAYANLFCPENFRNEFNLGFQY
ncbi:predicted protein [Naegleria gruberi]|uniref:Fucosyltransferase n=1 Tax=Naegleria gruberi TaxID=5762 RepID=D2UZK5_NAEGR|nr:uncharacterized protein NAEGRDRAFT_61972 [Naegleria gruberi]EFC49958.1 predicted protein [Naegleria gruberi]|eukprot:XP_002682702.1 predicted protein [Naegleria gruberi strain NEG-M]